MRYGSDGIPLSGKVEEYATELWLDDPSAFWLNPEGPLSETTPDEYRAKIAEREKQRRAAIAQDPLHNLASAGLLNNGFAQNYYAQMQQSAFIQSQLSGHYLSPYGNGLASLFGLR